MYVVSRIFWSGACIRCSARIRDDIIRLAVRAVVEVVVPLGLAEPGFVSGCPVELVSCVRSVQ